MREKGMWARRIVMLMAIAAGLAISHLAHVHPQWMAPGTGKATLLNGLYAGSLVFLLLGAPAWLLLGGAATVADRGERRAFRVDTAFSLGALTFVLLLVVLFVAGV